MRNTSKMTTLENESSPRWRWSMACIISKDADITVAFVGGTAGALHRDGRGV